MLNFALLFSPLFAFPSTLMMLVMLACTHHTHSMIFGRLTHDSHECVVMPFRCRSFDDDCECIISNSLMNSIYIFYTHSKYDLQIVFIGRLVCVHHEIENSLPPISTQFVVVIVNVRRNEERHAEGMRVMRWVIAEKCLVLCCNAKLATYSRRLQICFSPSLSVSEAVPLLLSAYLVDSVTTMLYNNNNN